MALRRDHSNRKPRPRDFVQTRSGDRTPKRDGTAARRLNYSRGRSYEYALKQVFESYGYCVTRAAGSHGHSDLIAGKGEVTWAIQVKARKPVAKEIRDIREASTLWHVNHLMAWKELREPWKYQAFLRGEEIVVDMAKVLQKKEPKE